MKSNALKVVPLSPRGIWCREGDKVYLCGTLGLEFDRYQRARASVSAAEGYEAQCLGLDEVEKLMDKLEAEARESLLSGETMLPRRSPGYGTMPLELSREILEKLDATRRLGVSLTPTYLLIPSKSVTAICQIVSQ